MAEGVVFNTGSSKRCLVSGELISDRTSKSQKKIMSMSTHSYAADEVSGRSIDQDRSRSSGESTSLTSCSHTHNDCAEVRSRSEHSVKFLQDRL